MEIQGLTLGQLIDLYDYASPPEVRKWLHENSGEWFEG